MENHKKAKIENYASKSQRYYSMQTVVNFVLTHKPFDICSNRGHAPGPSNPSGADTGISWDTQVNTMTSATMKVTGWWTCLPWGRMRQWQWWWVMDRILLCPPRALCTLIVIIIVNCGFLWDTILISHSATRHNTWKLYLASCRSIHMCCIWLICEDAFVCRQWFRSEHTQEATDPAEQTWRSRRHCYTNGMPWLPYWLS